MKPFSLVARQVAPTKTALQSCNSHTYSVLREELLAHGSAMHMRHLLVTLSVEFADGDTFQKAHYRPDSDNRSDNRCITKLEAAAHEPQLLFFFAVCFCAAIIQRQHSFL